MPEDLIVMAVALAVVGGIKLVGSLFDRDPRREGLAQAWRRTVKTCGLTDVKWVQGPLGRALEFVSKAKGLSVRFQTTGRGTVGTRILITGRPRERAGSLSLRREDIATAWRKGGGFHEIQIGDADFDQAVFIDGPPTLARAVLDAETRPLARALLYGQRIPQTHGGAWLTRTEGAFEAGELRLEIDASSAKELGLVLADVLPVFLDAARRLCQPEDVAVRLAHTARIEPLAEPRLQDLLTLAREFPEHAATREALRAALTDEDDEIRLRCAMAVEEGRDVLLEFASGRRGDDSSATRAIAALSDRLTLEEAQGILSEALRLRRIPVAAAVLEELGRRGDPNAVSTVTPLLRHINVEIAASAARGLGRSGLTAAEPALIAALERKRREVSLAAAEALGRVGSVAAVPMLKEAIAELDDKEFGRTARQAIATIQARVQGATPGQLSLADGQAQAGQLTLAGDEAGRLSLTRPPT